MAEKEESKEMTVIDKYEGDVPMSYADVRKNTELVKKALFEVMKNGVDYGKIPGCGDKPSLLKPGAEKLMLLFRLGCFPEVTDLCEPGLVKYKVSTKIVHVPSGRELAIGLGSCSSNEEKYKWRKATNQAEFDTTPEENRREKWMRGRYDYKTKKSGDPYTIQQVRTNPADLDNTILKMACKRSKIDGVITATAASDILSQDLDELVNQPEEKPKIQKPARKAAPKQEAPSKQQDEQGFREITAKFDGDCKGCPDPIKVGDTVLYHSKRGVFHPGCEGK